MLIQIIFNEKMKNSAYLPAIKEYQKRLSAFTRVTMLSLKDYIPDKREFLIQVERQGETISSEALSAQLCGIMLGGCSTITLSLTPLPHADAALCISNMKMSEELTLTVLHEQLYRSFMIMNNRTYHK